VLKTPLSKFVASYFIPPREVIVGQRRPIFQGVKRKIFLILGEIGLFSKQLVGNSAT
jgi:hypothetical protein